MASELADKAVGETAAMRTGERPAAIVPLALFFMLIDWEQIQTGNQLPSTKEQRRAMHRLGYSDYLTKRVNREQAAIFISKALEARAAAGNLVKPSALEAAL